MQSELDLDIKLKDSAVPEALKPLPIAEAEPFSMRRLALLLKREKRFIALITAAVAAVTIAIAFLLPNYYTATVVLMPPQQNRSVADSLLAQLGSIPMVGEMGIKDPNDVFIAILQSRTIADALIGQYYLEGVYHKTRAEDLREALHDATHIKSEKGGVITIAVEAKNASLAAAMANSYVAEMYKLNARMAVDEATQRRTLFEQQMDAARADLAKTEEEFKKTQQTTGIVNLDAQAKGIVERAAVLQQELAAKEVQVQAMRSFATEENPSLKLAEQELAGLQAQLSKIENQRNGTLDVPMSKLPAASVEYAEQLSNVKYKQAVVEALAKQFEIARVDEAKSAPMVQVIDTAVPPTKPSRPNRIAIILTAIISAFVFASGWILVRESLVPQPSIAVPLPRPLSKASGGSI